MYLGQIVIIAMLLDLLTHPLQIQLWSQLLYFRETMEKDRFKDIDLTMQSILTAVKQLEEQALNI